MLTTIFYHIDEFCKTLSSSSDIKIMLIDEKRERNREFRLALSEVMTIMIYYHHSGYKTFKDYYEKHVVITLTSEFKGLVAYNRFVELKKYAAVPLVLFTKIICLSNCTGISFVDSMSLAVCHNRRICSHKVFKSCARRGKTSVGWFYGFKLHLVINEYGQMIDFHLTSGNVADNNHQLLLDHLLSKTHGKVFGDKGYIVKETVKNQLLERGTQLITKLKKNMQNKLMDIYDKLLLAKRGIIESANGILKEILSIEHSRHRSKINFVGYIHSTIAAYFFREKKPSIVMPEAIFALKA